MEWKAEFNQIYFYDNGIKQKLTERKMGKFAIDINYIVGTNNYKKMIEKYFFEKYLNKSICYYEKISVKGYSMLVCNNHPSFDINSFPSLFFFHTLFNYTFELSKNELFLKKNNKYIFLVFFVNYDIHYFILGRIFLKKYLFIFNQDSRTIGFYSSYLDHEKIEDKININIIIKIVLIILIIVCCIIGFYLVKKIYEHSRKRRINEINDLYEYNSYEEQKINYENNSKKEIVLELPTKQ